MDRLPEELLSYVVTFLDNDVPSVFHAPLDPTKPSIGSDQQCLKSVSLLSRKFRRVAAPSLFKHLRFPLEDLLPVTSGSDGMSRTSPQHLSSSGIENCRSSRQLLPNRIESIFYDVAAMHGPDVSSVTIFSSRDTRFSLPPGSSTYSATDVLAFWERFFACLHPRRLILHASPTTLASLMSCDVDISDAWAFNIPHQRLELSRATDTTLVPHARSTLLAQPWAALAYSEGSSLNAYGTYHYFEKEPPCVVNPSLALPAWPALRSFSYTALFPHMTHLAALCVPLRRCVHLVRLAVQMAPAKDSPLLDDFEWIGKGNLSLRDCWNEIEGSYQFLLEAVVGLWVYVGAAGGQVDDEAEGARPRVVEFVSYDYDNEVVMSALDRWLVPESGWRNDGKGVFTRDDNAAGKVAA